VSLFLLQGATYLALKTNLSRQTQVWGVCAAVLCLIFFTLGWAWLTKIPGYRIVEIGSFGGPSNPLAKTVAQEIGSLHHPWLMNYTTYPWMVIAPILGYTGISLAAVFLLKNTPGKAFIASSFAQAGVIATAGLSLFPFILPSSSHPQSSLTVWDASSSHRTLFIMLIATVIFIPVIILYTSWVFRVLRGKVTQLHKDTNKHLY
jgi:cytochrome d ubiquinol oxidase subunit II